MKKNNLFIPVRNRSGVPCKRWGVQPLPYTPPTTVRLPSRHAVQLQPHAGRHRSDDNPCHRNGRPSPPPSSHRTNMPSPTQARLRFNTFTPTPVANERRFRIVILGLTPALTSTHGMGKWTNATSPVKNAGNVELPIDRNTLRARRRQGNIPIKSRKSPPSRLVTKSPSK